MRSLLLCALPMGAGCVALGCPLTPEPLPGGEPVVQDLPYEGQAFPNRRKPIDMPASGVAVVGAAERDALSVLGVATGDALGTFPVGRDPIAVDGPAALALDAAAGSAFVALAYPKLYEGVHAAHEGHPAALGWVQQLSLVDLRVLAEVEVDASPSALALSADGRRLVVAHFVPETLQDAIEQPQDLEFARGRLALVAPEGFGAGEEPEKVRTCVGMTDVTLSAPDGARAFVSCFGEDAVAIVDLDAPRRSVVRVAVGPSPGPPGEPVYGPIAAVLSADGARLAVACETSRELRVLEADGGAESAPPVSLAGTPGRPAWSLDDARLWLPERDPPAVVALDGATLAELDRRELTAAECAAPREVRLASADRLLVLCDAGAPASEASLLVLDTIDLAIVASAEVPAPARGLAWFAAPSALRASVRPGQLPTSPASGRPSWRDRLGGGLGR